MCPTNELHAGKTSRGGGNPRLAPVWIVRVDYGANELFDADGNGYYELPDGGWMKFGPVCEGSIRYWGSGSHAGHINLLPTEQYRDGAWVNVMGCSPGP